MNHYARRDPNPNTILVIFLVLFVILSIGLGVFGYLGFAGQEELRLKAVKLKEGEVKEANKAKDYAAFIGSEVRLALGAKDGEVLSEDEAVVWKVTRAEFFKEGGIYKDEPSRAAVENLVKELEADLGGFNKDALKYNSTYKQTIKRLRAYGLEWNGKYVQAEKDRVALSTAKQEFAAKVAEFKTEASDSIAKGNAAALAATKEGNKVSEDAFAANTALAATLKEKEDLLQKSQGELAAERTAHQTTRDKLALVKARLMAGVEGDTAAAGPADEKGRPLGKADRTKHALILDISRGKPMWDEALGKIKSVKDKHIVINRGLHDGIRPGLTFNVFSGKKGSLNPDQDLKGTIEVLRNIKEDTAEAIITEQFDPKNNPIKEDDLLFNMFWGTHVVVAGQVNWFGLLGTRAENPAEQTRNLDQFIILLHKQGIIVDAYVDLADGSLKGSITPRTRFLIRGQDLYEPKFGAAAEAKDDDDEKNAKQRAPTETEKIERARLAKVNANIDKIRNKCVDQGVLFISAENFAHITGIQRWRATSGPQPITFRAGLPSAN